MPFQCGFGKGHCRRSHRSRCPFTWTIGWIGDQVVLLPVLELVPDVEAVPDPLLEPGAAPPGAPPMPPVPAIRSFSVVPPEVVVEPKTLSPTLNDERETVEPLRCRCVDDVTV